MYTRKVSEQTFNSRDYSYPYTSILNNNILRNNSTENIVTEDNFLNVKIRFQ